MPQQNIFEIIPPHFFSVLSSGNQDTYADCLFLMFESLEKGNSFSAHKASVTELLASYFIQTKNEHEDEGREKAMGVLRRLHQCGWIFYEEEINYDISINFCDYAIPVIKTLLELKKEDGLEYLGYIYMIYSAVKNFDVDTLSDILDQIYYNTTIVLNKLKSLNANIKKYIQKLLNKTTVNDLQSIVDNLFLDYKKNIIDDHYQRLKTSDNISKYRPYIISKLNDLSLNEDMIGQVSQKLLDKHRFGNFQKARNHIYHQIEYIIRSFTSFDEIMDEIDRKNAKYIQMSISKILFIVNNKGDLPGKINRILSYYVKEKKLNDNLQLFNICTNQLMDENSIFTMPNCSEKSEDVFIENEKILSLEERQERLNLYLMGSTYNKKNIEKYVDELLENRDSIYASELPLHNYEDYTKLILIYMYSGNDVGYYIEKRLNRHQKEGYVFYDFLIRRRKNGT